MGITKRFFQLDSEWSIIHYPYQPNGFGVYIFGDKTHFVDSQTSFWLQHYGRNQLLGVLLEAGYTVFTSNLYGANWGSPKAQQLAMRIYHIVMKKEILNERVHILCEGMGALVAKELMKSSDKIRSAAMFNPCLNLSAHLEKERENKFFYKRLSREIALAYDKDPKEAGSMAFDESFDTADIPVHIWQRMNSITYPYQDHSKMYEEHRSKHGNPIDLTFHLADNQYRLHHSVVKFFKENEKNL
ncbi:hypothetical protein ACK1LH_04940 [Metabacillus indicus]|uniref:hypothetical protein n=1 Tax=Metabacillus indicus TaxID=246786 RepID=UPI0039841DC8